VVSLEAQVQSLRLDLRAAQIREEIALAMPHLLHRRAGRLAASECVSRVRARPPPYPGQRGQARQAVPFCFFSVFTRCF
jgi:hypothetical protein